MTVNHLPGNPMQRLTFQPFGFISNREVFVFLSGLVAAWLSGTAWQRQGTRALFSRVLKGIARIYFVSMGVTFALLLITELGGSRFADWHQLLFHADVGWERFVFSLITFRHTIVYVSLLRFYCLLLCILPLILYALKHCRERLVLVAAGTIWVVIQLTVGQHLMSLDKAWLPWIRILSCQPVYVLGAIIGYRRSIAAPSLMPKSKVLVPICVGLAGVLFVLRHQFPFATPEFVRFLGGQQWLIEERTVGPLRLLDFLVLLVATSFVLSKWASTIESFPLCRWLAYLGRHSIYVFAGSMITAYLGFLFRHQWAALPSMGEAGLALLMVLSLWVPAALHNWSQRSFKNVFQEIASHIRDWGPSRSDYKNVPSACRASLGIRCLQLSALLRRMTTA
jgi:hypothetical protein